MTKTKSAQPIKTASAPKAETTPVLSHRKGTAVNTKIAKTHSEQPSKQERVLDLLRRREGATVSAIMKTTGWQQHSVRGFLAGVVRKKLKLHLTARDDENGKRIYRIAGGKMPKSTGRTAR